MYHKVKVGQLSNTQISRLLNGHGIRVSNGSNHEVELSKEQIKKFMKAREKGKAMTLTMDPFQMQNHQYLRGSGGGTGNLTKTSKGSAKRIITSATDRLIRALEGSGTDGNLIRTVKDSGKRLIVSGTDRAIRAIEGSGIGGNIKATAKDSGKRLIVSGTDRAIRAIEGSGVNRLKKAQRWEQFANATVRDGIDTVGKAARVYRAATKPTLSDMLGFGLKKRKARKMKGSALLPAGL